MQMTRRHALLGAAGLWAASTAGAHAAPAVDWKPVRAALRKAIADRITPGAVAAVAQHGKVLFSEGFGLANLETATPMTPASVCRIGSITKQFTAAAILLLAEDGKLSVDDPLARFLPDYPRAADITLRQMLTHTSGLANYTDGGAAFFLGPARLDYDSKAMEKLMADARPQFIADPGMRYAYSNTAYVLLGLVIEKASGMAWPKFMAERVFTPAGLTHTAVDSADAVVPNRAAGYSPEPNAASRFSNAIYLSMTVPGAAGALRSTALDLTRWHAALLGGKVLKPESLKAMMTPGRLKSGELPKRLGKTGVVPVLYGFGLGLSPTDTRTTISHDGGIPGFTSHQQTYTDTGVSAVLLSNTDDDKGIGAAVELLYATASKVT